MVWAVSGGVLVLKLDFCYYIGAVFYCSRVFIISGKLLLTITVNFWADGQRIRIKDESWKSVKGFFSVIYFSLDLLNLER